MLGKFPTGLASAHGVTTWTYKAVASAVAVSGGILTLVAILFASPRLHGIRPSEAALVSGEADCRHGETSCPSLSVGTGKADASAKAPSFFGYLEFDWDPDAPRGIPGFGPLPPSNRSAYAKAAKESLSDPAGM